jgi:adhesin/invasin
MSIRLFTQWLIVLFLLGLLNACGGGGDEPSNLLSDTGGNVGGDPPPTTTNDFTNIAPVGNLYPQLVPSGGTITISFTTFIADEGREGEIAPNVSLKITIHPAGIATLKDVPQQTDRNGDARFTVSYPGSGNISINISGAGTVQGGIDIPLYFGATATADVITKGVVPADGQTSADIKVLARDSNGSAIAGIPVSLSFPLYSFAVPTVTGGTTDEKGEFATGITNTVAQTTKVTPIAGGMAAGSLTLTFGASTVVTVPEELDLIIKSNNVPANGSAKATLVVIARGASGTPVPHIPVSISSDSATSRLSIGDKSGELFIGGDTGEKGFFELDITNTVIEEVNIIATTTGGDETAVAEETIIFSSPESTTGAKVDRIELDELLNNEQFANGRDSVTMVGKVLDSDDNPIANLPVSILASGGSARIDLANGGKTNGAGFFIAAFRDEVVEAFSARAVIGDKSSERQIISFVAVPPPDVQVQEPKTYPQSITLLASPEQKLFDEEGTNEITITAIVRDNNRTPMSGIQVILRANVGTVTFDNNVSETGDGGTAIFIVSNTRSGEFTLTATAEGKSGPITTNKKVTFNAVATPVLNVATLDANVVNNNQPANGTDAITIDVVARDSSGGAVSGAPIIVQMSSGTTAVANPSREITDANGFFTTDITSTKASDNIKVTVAVEGTAVTTSRQIKFVATQVGADVTPATIDLQLSPNTPQVADGESKITLIVVPRDNTNTPLAGVSVKLISEIVDAQIAETIGVTNELGEFRTTVTSDKPQRFNITAVVEGILGDKLKSTKLVIFEPPVGTGTITTVDLQVINAPQPADGVSAITLVAISRDENNVPIAEVEVELISDSTTALIANPKDNTNALGEFRTTVTNTIAETFNVTAVANGVRGTPTAVTFFPVGVDVRDLRVTVVNNNQPADGTTAITINVVTRDALGGTVNKVPLVVQIPSGEAAVAKPSRGETDEDGFFTTEITSTEAGELPVTIAIEGSSITANPVNVKFLAATAVTPTRIELQVINAPKPADGVAAITLVAIPRDANNVPIAEVEVELISDSATALIANPKGTTNALGEFRTTVTNTIAETFNVTAVVGVVKGSQTAVTFLPVGMDVSDLQVRVVNNNQPADGTTAITVQVIARDASGGTVNKVPLIVRIPSGKVAIAIPSRGETDENGAFTTEITSTEAGEVPVTIAIEGTNITANPVNVKFLAASAVTPTTVELQVLKAPQPADGVSAITLVAIPRDAKNVPIADVDVQLISDSTTAEIETPTDKTNALGEFRTTVTNTIAETFNVTAVADGVKGNPTAVTFLPIGLDVSDLRVTVVNNNQPADGETGIKVDVATRDNGGQTVSGVPIIVQIATGEAAIATPSRGITEDGFFTTSITSTEAGEALITVSMEGTTLTKTVRVNFTAAQAGTSVDTVELIVKNAPQAADAQSEISLVVIARDAKGTPIPNVEVQLIKDSNDIIITGEGGDGITIGTTNALGEFRTTAITAKDLTDTLTSTLVVNVTPVAGGIVGDPTPVVFTPVGEPIFSQFTLTVINNNQEAGTDGTRLSVLVRDENGFPVAGVRVNFSVKPGDDPPNVAGSARISSEGADDRGVFRTNRDGVVDTAVTNSQPGTFKVTAKVLGKNSVPILDSNTVEVTFKGTPTAEVKDVSSLRLITSTPQLGSEGSIEGVLITAIVKNKDNNLVEGAVVNFSADSGEIQLIQIEGSSAPPGETDVSGRAQARLTTVGDADNRTITVTVTVPSATGKDLEETLTIDVTGTTIIISGQETVILGSTIDLMIFMKDSAGNGIAKQKLTVKSEKGNPIDNLEPVTNANGQVQIQLTANIAGQDTITVSKPNVVSDTFVINISDDNFTLNSVPQDVIEIKLNTPQEFLVHWDKAGTPQAFESIDVFTTRGELSANNVSTDINGDARFTVEANNSGPAIITVSTTVADGPSAQISVDFVATIADLLTLQADPVTISVNTPDSNVQQSEIIAVVRDPKKNLVKGKRIDFTLEDVTGGSLFPSSAVTDSFGRANTVYTAGISPSASKGVKVTAVVADTPAVNALVEMTVAAKSLFVTVGTGNIIEKDGPTRYKHPYTVLVNDANGVAVTDSEVVLSILPLKFAKGNYFWNAELKSWAQTVTSTCPNEDQLPSPKVSPDPGNRFNGILDVDEDFNNNGKLDPGNVATFDSGDVLKTVETDANGFADFYIVYPKENAYWVKVRLVAASIVGGSEGEDRSEFWLAGAADDYTDEKVSPPGNPSPFFGRGTSKTTSIYVPPNGILDDGEVETIIDNGKLDTEDKDLDGKLDPGEDGSITELPGRLCSPSSIGTDGEPLVTDDEKPKPPNVVAGGPNCNPRPGELDTEDIYGIETTSEYVDTCDNCELEESAECK